MRFSGWFYHSSHSLSLQFICFKIKYMFLVGNTLTKHRVKHLFPVTPRDLGPFLSADYRCPLLPYSGQGGPSILQLKKKKSYLVQSMDSRAMWAGFKFCLCLSPAV